MSTKTIFEITIHESETKETIEVFSYDNFRKIDVVKFMDFLKKVYAFNSDNGIKLSFVKKSVTSKLLRKDVETVVIQDSAVVKTLTELAIIITRLLPDTNAITQCKYGSEIEYVINLTASKEDVDTEVSTKVNLVQLSYLDFDKLHLTLKEKLGESYDLLLHSKNASSSKENICDPVDLADAFAELVIKMA